MSLPAYESSWVYLCDELKVLDLLIRLQLLRQSWNRQPNAWDQFKGLVLTEDEIAHLLTNETQSNDPQSSDDQSLLAQLEQTESQIKERRAASLQTGTYLSLAYLSHLFQLSRFEEQCLLICLAAEVDRKYDKLYAYLQDDVTRKKPSVDLVMSLLLRTPEQRIAARSAFGPQAALRRFRLIQMVGGSEETPLLSRFLKLDDRIAGFSLETDGLDTRLDRDAILSWTQVTWNEVFAVEETSDRMRAFVRNAFGGSEKVIFYFAGPDHAAKQSLMEATASELGRPIITADAAGMLSNNSYFAESAWLLGREALLQGAILCVNHVDQLFVREDKALPKLAALVDAAQTFSQHTFLFGEEPWRPVNLASDSVFLEIAFPIPTAQSRRTLWSNCLQNDQIEDHHFVSLASKFRFSQTEISRAIQGARHRAQWRSPERSELTVTDLYAACRQQSHHELAAMARRIEPVYTWDDIVLPADPIDQLRELCARVTQSSRVLGDWGFGQKLSQGKGANALFAGPSGTGKTMAAEIVANELCLDLYKIDLSGVVSKYIGETEKNLDRIFTAAEHANAILFFDEADALFGKRSEVRDSHDRYANIEISYLLQKMEQYEGVAILATNLRQNLDEAFVRRLAFTIHFPFPTEADRLRIWTGIWPRETPVVDDVDLKFLSRQFKLTGGNIKNIALGAAFFAAGDGGAVTMSHLLQATQREFQKMGKMLSEAELSGYKTTIEQGAIA